MVFPHESIVTKASVLIIKILKHLYALYGIEQSTNTSYNPHGNAQCEWFNCTMIGLLTYLSKEHKDNWPLHLPSLVFAYNAMPHSTTGYQPYELMFSCKAPTICDAWLRLADYGDNYLQSKCEWVNQQHELILAANRQALKRIKQSVSISIPDRRQGPWNTNRQLGITVWPSGRSK